MPVELSSIVGGLLGVEEFKTTVAGNMDLLFWLRAFGTGEGWRAGHRTTSTYTS
jgi:hypothetical protein